MRIAQEMFHMQNFQCGKNPCTGIGCASKTAPVADMADRIKRNTVWNQQIRREELVFANGIKQGSLKYTETVGFDFHPVFRRVSGIFLPVSEHFFLFGQMIVFANKPRRYSSVFVPVRFTAVDEFRRKSVGMNKKIRHEGNSRVFTAEIEQITAVVSCRRIPGANMISHSFRQQRVQHRDFLRSIAIRLYTCKRSFCRFDGVPLFRNVLSKSQQIVGTGLYFVQHSLPVGVARTVPEQGILHFSVSGKKAQRFRIRCKSGIKPQCDTVMLAFRAQMIAIVETCTFRNQPVSGKPVFHAVIFQHL